MGDLNQAEIISRLLPALAAVIALPLAVLWLQRRKRTGSQRQIRVTNRAAIGRNTWIAVVEVEGRRLLVAAGDKGVNLLTELEPEPEPLQAAAGLNGDDLLDRFKDDDGPRTGLVRRLQERTLRKAPTHRGPQFELDA